jgi:hypothetical protein
MTCDNSGNAPLIAPGFNDCPIDFELDQSQHFAHGVNDWVQHTRLTVRELSMLALMNALTDKTDWNVKIFNEETVIKWHKEALSMPLISERAWEWCLTELRDKARAFEQTGYVPAYDTGSGCIKSDSLVSEGLRKQLLQAVTLLQEVSDEEKDWHPRSNDQVLNLVHPSLFPLVYGKTVVLSQGGRVDLNNILGSCGKGVVAPAQELKFGSPEGYASPRYYNRGIHVEASRFSTKFQWLPCELEFQGETGNNVKITSYINNLHPQRHKSLYAVIEKLMSLSIEPWNKVLVYKSMNKTPMRIRTFGSEFDPPFPDWAHYNPGLLRSRVNGSFGALEELLQRTREYMAQPDNPDYVEESNMGRYEAAEHYARIDGTWDQSENLHLPSVVDWKWKRIRKIAHPEPGVAYPYEDWKAGRIEKAVVPATRGLGMERTHEWYTVDLATTWRDRGLQVIVKLSSIELTPDKPKYDGGSWHIEGMLNEHIVATSIYYYDVENTTESRIRFRQEASLDDMRMKYAQDEHEPLCQIFGTDSLRDEVAVQELGSIATPQGRLLVFPNTLQHQVDPFHLEDPSKPGHRRFIVMWLVDPHYRITSTRNVPPQRHDWWAPEGYHKAGIDEKLPAELANMVKNEVGEWPMGLEEAKQLRLELMDERTNMMPLVESNFQTYNFCEH